VPGTGEPSNSTKREEEERRGREKRKRKEEEKRGREKMKRKDEA
jgi:hypothetical protein